MGLLQDCGSRSTVHSLFGVQRPDFKRRENSLVFQHDEYDRSSLEETPCRIQRLRSEKETKTIERTEG